MRQDGSRNPARLPILILHFVAESFLDELFGKSKIQQFTPLKNGNLLV
jgi:hypothetical protein